MDFYEDAIKTLEIIVRALNGNTGAHSFRRRDTPRYNHGKKAFDRKCFLTNRRKVMPCNRNKITSITE